MNHALVIVPGSISEARLDTHLREIVRDRWGDLVSVVREGGTWTVSWGDDYRFGLSVWLKTSRQIEMRKQLGELSTWLQTFIQESLASRLNGKCTDEGTPGRRWDGKPEDWLTFRQWWDEINGPHGRKRNAVERRLFDSLFKRATANIPKELLCTDESRSARV